MAASKASKKVMVADHKSFGFDHEKLASETLFKLIQEISKDQEVIPSHKHEMVKEMEEHYAQQRRAGKLSPLPCGHLSDDFDPQTYTKAQLRQVLVQHGLKYKPGATKGDLVEIFSEHKRSMRGDTPGVEKEVDSPAMAQPSVSRPVDVSPPPLGFQAGRRASAGTGPTSYSGSLSNPVTSSISRSFQPSHPPRRYLRLGVTPRTYEPKPGPSPLATQFGQSSCLPDASRQVGAFNFTFALPTPRAGPSLLPALFETPPRPSAVFKGSDGHSDVRISAGPDKPSVTTGPPPRSRGRISCASDASARTSWLPRLLGRASRQAEPTQTSSTLEKDSSAGQPTPGRAQAPSPPQSTPRAEQSTPVRVQTPSPPTRNARAGLSTPVRVRAPSPPARRPRAEQPVPPRSRSPLLARMKHPLPAEESLVEGPRKRLAKGTNVSDELVQGLVDVMEFTELEEKERARTKLRQLEDLL